jgi:mediator of RNA polymerase II transcription subunit 31
MDPDNDSSDAATASTNTNKKARHRDDGNKGQRGGGAASASASAELVSSSNAVVDDADEGNVKDKDEDDEDGDDDTFDDALDLVDDKKRFEWELEFVQCLASPAYLHFLATYRDDNDDDDINSEDDGEDDAPTKTSKRKKKASAAKTTGTVLLQDRHFLAYLRYLRDTWSRPEYAIYLMYPHCLYFLNLIVDHPTVMAREWAQPAYRNFCHQQQFLAWQHRHATLYGRGRPQEPVASASASEAGAKDPP